MVLMVYRVLFVVIQREDEEEYNQEYNLLVQKVIESCGEKL